MDATLSGCAMASARVIIGQQLGATGGEVYACCTKASRAQVSFFDHLRMHHLLVYSTDEPRVAEQLSSSPAPCCRQERFLRSNGTIWPATCRPRRQLRAHKRENFHRTQVSRLGAMLVNSKGPLIVDQEPLVPRRLRISTRAPGCRTQKNSSCSVSLEKRVQQHARLAMPGEFRIAMFAPALFSDVFMTF